MSKKHLILLGVVMVTLQVVFAQEVENKTEEIEAPIAETEAPVIERSSHFHLHHDHHHEDPTFQGFWKKKFVWRPRWVKTWQEKKVYVAVWKRMWGPVLMNEWVPIPKPPPGWIKHESNSVFVKTIPH